ncbi:NTP transferase domain-containing protein, partial [bacterium]|nr:NTP transferase domain-containing protein [bacterium]
MKGVILAAGRGTRLRPLTDKRSKPLIPLANRPLISYPLHKLIEAGITEIGIVVGENEEELRSTLGCTAEPGAGTSFAADLHYIKQDQPLGLAHAVKCAEAFCAGEEFVLLFCDNLFAEPLKPALAEWRKLDAAALVHTYEMAEPRASGVAVVEDGWVLELEEKPERPKSNLAVVGI